MALSNELLSQFAKITNDKTEPKKETIAYGKAITENGTTYVRLDGSDRWTPVQTTTAIKSEDKESGERVTVLIKDHSATIIGNTSSPAARNEDVETNGKRLDEFDIIVSYKITTEDLNAVNATLEKLQAVSAKYETMSSVTAEIETLKTTFANLGSVTADDVDAINANIETLHAMFGEFTDLSAEDLDVVNAEIDDLKGHTASFTYVSTELLKAYKAVIEELETKKLNADFANVDYASIDQATFQEFYAKSGMVQYVTTEDMSVTGYLVGVTIKGDYIEGGTITADKLIIKNDKDGLYYKLNVEAGAFTAEEEVPTDKLHGSVIAAKTITAEQMSVSDLSAFKATIGGFKMDDTAIYSGGKASMDADNMQGIHLSSDGQIAIGDTNNYFKYYKDENGDYRFALAVESIFFGVGKNFTLDDRGMTVEGQSDDSNNTIKTNISNNGMTVYGNDKEMLSANDKGVSATDLHARTYLKVGTNSRFENFGDDRTGCFWIGN